MLRLPSTLTSWLPIRAKPRTDSVAIVTAARGQEPAIEPVTVERIEDTFVPPPVKLTAVELPRASNDDGLPWCNGVWPDDPDEVPGWRLAAEIQAKLYGYRLPSYRTRREFEAMLERCRAAEEHSSTDVIHPPLPAMQAAREFVAALRAADRTGDYTVDELAAAYLDHCTAQRRAPTKDRALRIALGQVPGVWTHTVERSIDGKRHRPTIWHIGAAGETRRRALPAIPEGIRLAA